MASQDDASLAGAARVTAAHEQTNADMSAVEDALDALAAALERAYRGERKRDKVMRRYVAPEIRRRWRVRSEASVTEGESASAASGASGDDAPILLQLERHVRGARTAVASRPRVSDAAAFHSVAALDHMLHTLEQLTSAASPLTDAAAAAQSEDLRPRAASERIPVSARASLIHAMGIASGEVAVIDVLPSVSARLQPSGSEWSSEDAVREMALLGFNGTFIARWAQEAARYVSGGASGAPTAATWLHARIMEHCLGDDASDDDGSESDDVQDDDHPATGAVACDGAAGVTSSREAELDDVQPVLESVSELLDDADSAAMMSSLRVVMNDLRLPVSSRVALWMHLSGCVFEPFESSITCAFPSRWNSLQQGKWHKVTAGTEISASGSSSAAAAARSINVFFARRQKNDAVKALTLMGHADMLYHGTSWSSAERIAANGVSLDFTTRNFDSHDFGRAFYLTPQLDTAIQYALSTSPGGVWNPAILVYSTAFLQSAPAERRLVLTADDELWSHAMMFSHCRRNRNGMLLPALESYHVITSPVCRSASRVNDYDEAPAAGPQLQVAVRSAVLIPPLNAALVGIIFFQRGNGSCIL